jgi:hypothetical protein
MTEALRAGGECIKEPTHAVQASGPWGDHPTALPESVVLVREGGAEGSEQRGTDMVRRRILNQAVQPEPAASPGLGSLAPGAAITAIFT